MEKQGHSLLAVCVSIPKALSLSLSRQHAVSVSSRHSGARLKGETVPLLALYPTCSQIYDGWLID